MAGNARVANRQGLLARLQNIEYVVGFNIDRRVQDSWGVVTTVPGRGRRLPHPGAARGRRDQRRHPRRGHRPGDRAGPGRLAGGLRADRAGVDRGARDARAAVAAALPVELRDHAVAVEAPARRGRERGVRAHRPGGAAASPRCSRSSCRCWRRWSTSTWSTGCCSSTRSSRRSRGAACCSCSCCRRGRVPAGGRAGAVAVAAARAAAGVPAAHVRGAHPVHRDGGRRGRPALAEDPAHRATSAGCRPRGPRHEQARNALRRPRRARGDRARGLRGPDTGDGRGGTRADARGRGDPPRRPRRRSGSRSRSPSTPPPTTTRPAAPRSPTPTRGTPRRAAPAPTPTRCRSPPTPARSGRGWWSTTRRSRSTS